MHACISGEVLLNFQPFYTLFVSASKAPCNHKASELLLPVRQLNIKERLIFLLFVCVIGVASTSESLLCATHHISLIPSSYLDRPQRDSVSHRIVTISQSVMGIASFQFPDILFPQFAGDGYELI